MRHLRVFATTALALAVLTLGAVAVSAAADDKEEPDVIFVPTPQEVVEKILFQHELFRHDRFLGQISVGDLPHRNVLHAIELFGTEVAPAVRAELGRGGSSGAQTSPGASS